MTGRCSHRSAIDNDVKLAVALLDRDLLIEPLPALRAHGAARRLGGFERLIDENVLEQIAHVITVIATARHSIVGWGDGAGELAAAFAFSDDGEAKLFSAPRGQMKVGIFDHLDRNTVPLHEFYEQRLKLVEAYDRGGFYSYHTAEHHATPLGLAPSPSVFLAAVAQRTQNLRFGPLVYTLPMHHPLRVAEEICMLDQISRGRFDLGVGRGISPIETAYYGIDPDQRQKMYLEALQVLRLALTSRIVSFRGQFYDYSDVPIELEPFQKPHPPFWAGAGTPDGAAAAGQNGFNLVANALTAQIRTMTERYRAACKVPPENGAPLLGLARFVIMGETDEQALTIARRAYPLWHRHFHHLFRMHGTTPAGGDRPPQFDQIKDGGRGIAGAPDTVIRMIQSQMEEAGTNYFVAQFAFGDLTPSEVMRTIDLFTREVMPTLRAIQIAPC
jgi:alkanesulfonate monooxygenase SsuD/methylene tetrahydromethanopterin reductase-like flavin-dependent oxidoreductase (luciferase family)